MTLEHCGFVYNYWFTCKKGSVKVNRTKQKQKKMVTLYNKVLLVNIVNNICKHELRINNTSTAFINLS